MTTCEYCGSPLPYDGTDRKYCKNTHQQAASRKRRHQKRALALLCPHSEKIKFSSKDEALAKAVRVTRKFRGISVRAYQCPAGHWHLTRKYAKVK